VLLKLKALDLAKYILVKAEILGQPVSNFQLQQILYIIQKYFLLKDKYAFLEYFYAWRMGPVIPRVYCEFSYYAGHPIRIAHFTKPFIVLPFVPDFKEVVNSIIEKCCQLRSVEMQKITCCDGGAWECVYDKGKGLKQEIPYLMIKTEKCRSDITNMFNNFFEEDLRDVK
jgi:Uncharacterized phage-associated protein